MKQRDIVLVPFPFADQSGKKIRPALIVSNDKFNQSSDDVIVCAVTSVVKPSRYSILINKEDIEDGFLYESCSIKVENIFKIKKSLVIKSIARINKSLLLKVVDILHILFNPD